MWQCRPCPSASGHRLSDTNSNANINCNDAPLRLNSAGHRTAAASPSTGQIRGALHLPACALCSPAVRKALGRLLLFLVMISGIWYMTSVLPTLTDNLFVSLNQPTDHSASEMDMPTGLHMKMTQILKDFELKSEIYVSQLVNDLKTDIMSLNEKVTSIELQNRQFVASFDEQIQQLREESHSTNSLLQQRLAAQELQADMMNQELSSVQVRMNLHPPITEAPVSPARLTPEFEDVLEKLFKQLQPGVKTFDHPMADMMANFALESQGASVVSHRSSETYRTTPPVWTFFGIPIRFPMESLRKVIQGKSRLLAGQCWPFPGEQGDLVISLSHLIAISHVTVDHLPRNNSPTGQIASAPKNFQVFGMRTEDEIKGTWLGKFTYDQDGDATQTFELPAPDKGVFRFVRLEVLSNWGHPDYTCLYRFRVHGQIPSLQKPPRAERSNRIV